MPVTRRKKRGNGQGYVYKAANGTWRARVTLGYIIQPDGSVHRKTRTKCGFATKKEALAALPGLKKAQENPGDYLHLIVRVGGFSAHFVDLDRSVQDDIINRCRHSV